MGIFKSLRDTGRHCVKCWSYKIKALSLPPRSFQSNDMEKYGNEGQCNVTMTFNADH